VKFSQYLIDFKGKDFVCELLDSGIRFLMILEVDNTSGRVLELKWIRTNIALPEHFEEELKCRFKTDSISFYLRFQRLPGKTDEESHNLIRREWRIKKKSTHIINVAFPGEVRTFDFCSP